MHCAEAQCAEPPSRVKDGTAERSKALPSLHYDQIRSRTVLGWDDVSLIERVLPFYALDGNYAELSIQYELITN